MVTLEEIRKENARLKSQLEVRKDFNKRDFEKRQLMQENYQLRNPKKYALFKGAQAMGKNIGTKISKYAEQKAKESSKPTRRTISKPTKSRNKGLDLYGGYKGGFY